MGSEVANQDFLISSKKCNIVRVINLHATPGYMQGYEHSRANLEEHNKIEFRKFFTTITEIMNNKIHGAVTVLRNGRQRMMPTDANGMILNPLVVFQMDFVTEEITNMAKDYQDAYYRKIASYSKKNGRAETLVPPLPDHEVEAKDRERRGLQAKMKAARDRMKKETKKSNKHNRSGSGRYHQSNK